MRGLRLSVAPKRARRGLARLGRPRRSLHAHCPGPEVHLQSIYEFWAVATRPISANGLGLTVTECREEVTRIKHLFRFLPDQPTLFSEWERLVLEHACYGRVSFDARLVAAMRTHGIARILTFNGSDFVRFPDLVVLDPANLDTSATTLSP